MGNLSVTLWTAFLLWCCIPSKNIVQCLSNETDRLSLLAFKAAIEKDPYGALSSWNDTLDYCSWNGVFCSQSHQGRVVALALRNQGLVGSLSPHVGNLSFLRTIILQNNSFRGRFPPEIGRLFRLRRLEISNNSFSGELPKNLSHCSDLRVLNVIDNDFSGDIPPEFGSFSRLEALALGKNQFSRTIPSFIGNLSALRRFSWAYGGLQGQIPDEIGRLMMLEFFQLSMNSLTGNIPSGLYNSSTLFYFSVSYNQLEGNVPADIGLTLPNLQFLGLGDNLLTGLIPFSLSNASLLGYIDFSSNNFTGHMPRDLGSLPNLEVIIFRNNSLEDDFSFFSSLVNCSILQYMQFDSNYFRGSIPASIANFSKATRLISVDNNNLDGIIPSGIGNLQNLAYLTMSLNYFTGPIPSTFGRLRKLQELDLSFNLFSGELPAEFGNVSTLNSLALRQNDIFGAIPPSLGKCDQLLDLDLSYNNLSGLIPVELMNLSSLTISFNLAHNALNGSIPIEVRSLRTLGVLDFSNNMLSGTLPSSLSECVTLEELHLDSNSFDGGIPLALNALKGLQVLDLSLNNFSGLIPGYLSELPLEKLNLSYNRLRGEVPTKGVFGNTSTISLTGNEALCGGIRDLHFPPCPTTNSNKKKSFGKLKIIIPVAVVASISLALLVFLLVFFQQRRTTGKKKGPEMPSFRHQFLRISYAELVKATDNFSEANLIGAGSYSSVYKGILDQGQMVAVKVLNLNQRGASKTFMSECEALRSIRHRNLLKILSACSSVDFQGNDFKALVYEFMSNGSLEKWLHHESRHLGLMQRLNISIDIASAVEYLHSGGGESAIVHGDLKPSNILLDDNMTAHVGDFGLAKIISAASSVDQTNSFALRGTLGYVAPEYGISDVVSPQGDTYSYGILLLEMFSGRRPTSECEMNLHSTIKDALPEQVMEVTDPSIVLEDDDTKRWIKDCMVSVLKIGIACSMESPKHRMDIGEALRELLKIREFYLKQV